MRLSNLIGRLRSVPAGEPSSGVTAAKGDVGLTGSEEGVSGGGEVLSPKFCSFNDWLGSFMLDIVPLTVGAGSGGLARFTSERAGMSAVSGGLILTVSRPIKVFGACVRDSSPCVGFATSLLNTDSGASGRGSNRSIATVVSSDSSVKRL